ncbi:J domain-containing protein [Herbiconiux sp. SYSU D00978]|uniref:J domain-containing protein n=1 Tax=Herbiconiux sp. SYSU D00978 TaxID=2812562 RepID=UPI001A96EE2A|nr:DnaJ domain-containing protein [Herbiconiux sp. SYSU D00978]
MSDSPMSATPYEILGVAATASHDELRRAYRRLARETHPDTGGDPARFIAVQRAWELVATPEDRAQYDRGRATGRPDIEEAWAAPASGRPERRDTRPTARSYGHPGGWRRERYLAMIREYVGLGEPIADPYDPALVRRAPREIRHVLADALAEEATARTLAELGIGFTVWHDVDATGFPEDKVDHVVLGPTGLWALLSEDFGGPVRFRRGELIGEAVGDDRPMHRLGVRAKALRRSLGVRFTALVIVLPDDAFEDPYTVLGSIRGATTVVVRQSYLAMLLRSGVPDVPTIGGTDLFEVRTRLQAGIRFV